jgi:hypothetical protein
MKNMMKTALVASILVSTSALAGPLTHSLDPQVGVEVPMYATQANKPFDFRTLLGVIIPGVGKEVHMGDLASAEAAAAAYDPDGVPATWRAINPAVGVEKNMMY